MDGQCTVEINGKTVGLEFTRYAIEEGNKIKGNIGSTSKNILGWVWGGIQGYYFKRQQDIPVAFEEVHDWAEQLGLGGGIDKELEKINEAYQSSLVYKHLRTKQEEVKQEDEEPTEEKKSNNLTSSGSYLQAS